MVRVREARPDDRSAIRDCHVAAIRVFGPDAYEDRQVAAWADKGDPEDDYPVEASGHYLVVAERDDHVVGYGHLVPTEAEIRAVYVHPDAARDGVGTTVLDALEARARDLALDSLRLWASLNAVGFYERAGYERVGRETVMKIHDGENVDIEVVEMENPL
jgi:putative acetyltransferase